MRVVIGQAALCHGDECGVRSDLDIGMVARGMQCLDSVGKAHGRTHLPLPVGGVSHFGLHKVAGEGGNKGHLRLGEADARYGLGKRAEDRFHER